MFPAVRDPPGLTCPFRPLQLVLTLGMHGGLSAGPCPIYKISFVSQVQEAASRGLKFVSVVPQYQSSVSSAGSRHLEPVANSVEDATDVRYTFGDHSPLENDTPKAADMDAATVGVNRRSESNPGSTGEIPSAQQPGIPSPSEENEAGEFPLQGLRPTLDGSEGDPSNGHEELPSRSKCQCQGF